MRLVNKRPLICQQLTIICQLLANLYTNIHDIHSFRYISIHILYEYLNDTMYQEAVFSCLL